jgi:hypothetical protein
LGDDVITSAYWSPQLIDESGYSVAQIIIWKPECEDSIISTLENFGCGVNTHLADNYVVVSIPPELLYSPVRAFYWRKKL